MKNDKSYKHPSHSLKSKIEPKKSPATYDLNQREQMVSSIMLKLQRLPHSLFKKDLDYWSIARAQAMSINMPRRWQLSELYQDVLNDLHLHGIINKRILKISNKKFKLTNLKGEEMPDLLPLIDKAWFRHFLKYSMESIFYGYSLIEFEFNKAPVGGLGAKCWVVDRRYVVPEFSMFLTNPGNYEGYVFTAPPFDSIAVGVGRPNDLGLLLKLSIYALIKKNAIGNWSEYAEIFGMPMRFASTPTSDPKIRQDLENMLDQMGSAAWGLFPQGTEVQIKEAAKTDSFNIYNQLIERINSEMSKAVLGQTMTTDNGSSRSQAEVHEHAENEITNDDKLFIRDVVNDQLIPLLIKNGYPLTGIRFDWNDGESMDLKKRSEIDEAVARMGYKPTKEYIEKTYSIELEEPEPIEPISSLPIGEGRGGADKPKA